jgi:fibronectin-binding autotransporter adhesin
VNNLTLGGTLNVTETVPGSFLALVTSSKWRLINFSGTLTDNGLTIGSMPPLPPGATFGIETPNNGGPAGQINLVVTVPEPASLGLLTTAAPMILRRRKR